MSRSSRNSRPTQEQVRAAIDLVLGVAGDCVSVEDLGEDHAGGPARVWQIADGLDFQVEIFAPFDFVRILVDGSFAMGDFEIRSSSDLDELLAVIGFVLTEGYARVLRRGVVVAREIESAETRLWWSLGLRGLWRRNTSVKRVLLCGGELEV